MINPQMGIPNVPSVKELWKNEKEKYRHWILLFGIGILIVFALQLTSFIMNVVSASTIKDVLQDPNKNYLRITNNTLNDNEALNTLVNAEFTSKFIIFPIIQFSLVGLGIIYFISTVQQSYKKHSFARISQWSTMIIGIGTFWAIFQLFQMSWNPTKRIIIDNKVPGGILQFINYFLIIAVYFSTSIKVTKIVRQFAISERVEKLKNDPMFHQQMEAYKNMMQNGGMQMGPMGPMVKPQTTNSNSNVQKPNVQTNQQEQIQKPKMSKEEKDLNNMTVTELKAVAKKLLISGSDKMKKDELIKAILRVTNK